MVNTLDIKSNYFIMVLEIVGTTLFQCKTCKLMMHCTSLYYNSS